VGTAQEPANAAIRLVGADDVDVTATEGIAAVLDGGLVVLYGLTPPTIENWFEKLFQDKLEPPTIVNRFEKLKRP
jgi:hypothetical protein